MNERFRAAQHPALETSRTRSARTAAERFAGIADADAVEAAAAAFLADADHAEALLAPLIAALHADPWFEPPFKVSRDRLRTGAVLLDCPSVTLSATVTCATALNRLPPPATLVLPGRVTLTRYIRGGAARMRRWQVDPARADFSAADAVPARELDPLVLEDGALHRQDGRVAGHLLTGAASDIVALTATIKPGAAPLMREYAVTDGAFVRAACADDTASRIEMLLTFLRASGRADEGALFEGITRHPAFHLRWATMREWLMLDARAARHRLAEMAAGDPNAEIRAAAAITLGTVDQRLKQPCPA